VTGVKLTLTNHSEIIMSNLVENTLKYVKEQASRLPATSALTDSVSLLKKNQGGMGGPKSAPKHKKESPIRPPLIQSATGLNQEQMNLLKPKLPSTPAPTNNRALTLPSIGNNSLTKIAGSIVDKVKSFIPTPKPTVTGHDTQVMPPPRFNPPGVVPQPQPQAPHDTRLLPRNPYQSPNPADSSVRAIPTIPRVLPGGQPTLIPNTGYDPSGDRWTPGSPPTFIPPNTPGYPLGTDVYDNNAGNPVKATVPGLQTPQKQQILQSAISKVPQSPDLSSKYGMYKGTIYNKSTSQGYSSPDQFFKDAGVKSFDGLKFDNGYRPPSDHAQTATTISGHYTGGTFA